MVGVGFALLDGAEARPLPGAHSGVVPQIWVDRDPTPAAFVPQMPCNGASGVRAQPTSACVRDQKHVDAARIAFPPHLEIANRPSLLFDDERFDVRSPQVIEHLCARERLLVPVTRDIGICMPPHEQVSVLFARASHDGALAPEFGVAADALRICQVSSTAPRSRAGALSQ
jgi:hypothetical protein